MKRSSFESVRQQRAASPVSEKILAEEILLFLADTPERLAAFLAMSGLRPEALRTALGDTAFRGGLLDYIASDDDVLQAFAAHSARSPDTVGTAIMRLRNGHAG